MYSTHGPQRIGIHSGTNGNPDSWSCMYCRSMGSSILSTNDPHSQHTNHVNRGNTRHVCSQSPVPTGETDGKVTARPNAERSASHALPPPSSPSGVTPPHPREQHTRLTRRPPAQPHATEVSRKQAPARAAWHLRRTSSRRAAGLQRPPSSLQPTHRRRWPQGDTACLALAPAGTGIAARAAHAAHAATPPGEGHQRRLPRVRGAQTPPPPAPRTSTVLPRLGLRFGVLPRPSRKHVINRWLVSRDAWPRSPVPETPKRPPGCRGNHPCTTPYLGLLMT